MKKITVIVPAHNEAENITVLCDALSAVFEKLKTVDFRVLFIDDGSTDGTFEIINNLSKTNEKVKGIQLARNFGHQIALKAGIDNATGDAVIMMDADLQCPPALIPDMIARWQEGYKIVGTIRQNGEEIGWFKRFSSRPFYKFINLLSDVPIVHSAADFRLLDASIFKVLADMPEQDLFFRGLTAWLGGRQIQLPFKVCKRNAGDTSYSLRKMIRLAVDGVTSFSTKPLRFAVYLGFLFSGLSTLYLPYIVYSYLQGVTVPGWTSILTMMVFFGGVQLMVLGVIGIYLGKIFKQSKARPLYIIQKKV